jgi:hypothetical protein
MRTDGLQESPANKAESQRHNKNRSEYYVLGEITASSGNHDDCLKKTKSHHAIA